MSPDIFNPKEPKDETTVIVTKSWLQGLSEDERITLFEQMCRDVSTVKGNLKRLLAIKKLVQLFCETLHLSEKDIKSLVAIASREEEKAKLKTTWNISDIANFNVASSSDILPGIFRDGGFFYIFGGKAKTGKTLLLYHIAICVAFGKECLNRPVKKGLVDIYQLEEPPGLFNKRLQEGGLDLMNPEIQEAIESDWLRVHTDFNLESDLQELKEYLLERKPRLVIIDSFRAATRDTDISENSAEFGKFAYALQRIASITGVTMIIIHHLNKSADTSKGADGLSGSGAIQGANDGMAFVYPGGEEYKDDSSSHVLQLLTIPREGLPVHLIVGRDTISDPNGYWKYNVLDEVNIDPSVVRFTTRILGVLSRHVSEELSKSSLASKLNTTIKDKHFLTALSRLVEGCQISRIKKKENGIINFYYSIGEDNPWPEYFKGSRSKITELADKALAVSSQAEAIEFINSISKEDQSTLWSSLETTERDSFMRYYSPPTFVEGNWVRDKNNLILKITKLEYNQEHKSWNYYCDDNETYKFTKDDFTLETNYSEASIL